MARLQRKHDRLSGIGCITLRRNSVGENTGRAGVCLDNMIYGQ
jgi:hypothetical protein